MEVRNIGNSGDDGYEVFLSGIKRINTIVSKEKLNSNTVETSTAIGKSANFRDVKTAEIRINKTDGKIRIEPGEYDPEQVQFIAKTFLNRPVVKNWNPNYGKAKLPWYLVTYPVVNATLYYEITTSSDGDTTTAPHDIGGNWNGISETVSDQNGESVEADRATLTFIHSHKKSEEAKEPVSLEFRAGNLSKIDILHYE